MRDIKRIKPFLDKFRELWESKEDFRFGQLVYRISAEMTNPDIFYQEEKEWLEAMEKVMIKDREDNL